VTYPVANGKEDDFVAMDVKVPVWQFGPGVVDSSLVGMDLFTHPTFRRVVNDIRQVSHEILSEIIDLQFLLGYTNDTLNAIYHPRSIIAEPVLEDFKNGSKVVGVVFAVEPWEHYFENILPHGVNGFVVDVEETCGSSFSFAVDGPEVHYYGEGDLHDPKYSDLAFPSKFATIAAYNYETASELEHCEYTVVVYPSTAFEETFHTSDPYVFAAVVFCVFLFTTLVFVFYDYLVQRRQNKVLSTAQRTAKIVTSLFPKEIGKRLLEESAQQQEKEEGRGRFGNAAKNELRSFLNEDPNDSVCRMIE
jgi:sensor histidine kinase YesM